jgi:hypothetical protein
MSTIGKSPPYRCIYAKVDIHVNPKCAVFWIGMGGMDAALRQGAVLQGKTATAKSGIHAGFYRLDSKRYFFYIIANQTF